ncbi:MAG: orotidine-5'-phosphate decarboxylase [Porticoccaceae bacterium]
MNEKSAAQLAVDQPIIVALDYSTGQEAENFVGTISPHLCKLKVGKELFTAAGPQLVSRLVNAGFDVFLDMKFHDIPNTVARAVSAAADLGVWMLNVHASGGSRMMIAAREAADRHGGGARLIAVTVLTSMTESDMREIGVSGGIEAQVMSLAALANSCGLDGVVCSAGEARQISNRFGENFLRVTPGIRLNQSNFDAGDQRRVFTPVQAMAERSSYLVIGRPVTQADDPQAALLVIRDQVEEYYRVGQKPYTP